MGLRALSHAQVAVIACQLVVHCRLQADMGILQKPEFDAIVARKTMQLPFLPSLGSEAVLLRSGYEAHKARQRPPSQNAPADLPKAWAAAEKCRVEEVSPLGVLFSTSPSPLWMRKKGCVRTIRQSTYPRPGQRRRCAASRM